MGVRRLMNALVIVVLIGISFGVLGLLAGIVGSGRSEDDR